MNSSEALGKPITELETDEEKVECYKSLKEAAEEASEEAIRMAERNKKFYLGEHYLQEDDSGEWVPLTPRKGAEFMTRTQSNDLYEMIQSLLPLHVKNEPEIQVVPEDMSMEEKGVDLSEEDEEGNWVEADSDVSQAETGEALTEILDTQMHRNGEQITHSNIILESFLSGAAYTTFQVMKSRRLGTIVEPKLLRRENFLPDPFYEDSQDFSDCRYMILRQYLTPSEIKLWFDVDEREYIETEGGESRLFGFASKWIQRVKNSDQQITKYGMRHYPVDTLYYSHVVPLIAFSQEDITGDVPDPMQYTFINGAHLAREIVNPFIHQDYPVTAFVASPVPGKPDGISDISQLIGTQMAINLMTNAIIDAARFMGAPRIFAEEGALPAAGWNLGAGGVTILPKDKLDRIKEMQNGGMNQAAHHVVEMLKHAIKTQAGDSSGLLSGAVPPSIQSGKHANVVLNSLLTRHGHTVKMFDASWERFSRQRVQLLQQFVDFDTAYWRRQYDAGEYQLMGPALRNFRFDIKLHSKSDLPFDPMERINMVVQLWMLGLVDLPYVFKVLDLDVSPQFIELANKQAEGEFIVGLPGPEQALMRAQMRQKEAEMGILSGQASPEAPLTPEEQQMLAEAEQEVFAEEEQMTEEELYQQALLEADEEEV